jgi:predicted NAD/FAD-dependent oxidoreductase
MAREAMLARFQPCWTAIFAFDAPLPTDASHIRDGHVIGWASRETNKPGRTGLERWVVQASASWSADCLEEPAEDVADALLMALAKELQLPPLQPIAQSTHRWRFAMSTGLGTGSLWNSHIGLGVCGDWLLGPRIECGWLSGRHLSGKILVEELVAVAD